MKIKTFGIFFIALFVTATISAQVPIEEVLLPFPQKADVFAAQGHISIGKNIYLETSSSALKKIATIFSENALQWANQRVITVNKSSAKAKISLQIFPKLKLAPGGYELKINAKGIQVQANSAAGIRNGLNSFLQLLIARHNNIIPTIPYLEIQDAPQYAWRGFMLDESRHFFGKKEVKKILNQMALFKLNKFHWHLTDEPGWRIEIKKYPLLTTIGAKGNYTDSTAILQYYTQKDIKEIVQYAADRGIDIIPEIDMPGHATAANKAYPEYSGGGSPKHPDFTFNPGKEKVYTFLTDIIREVKTLFPSHMIHIGGDEVSYGNDQWKSDSYIAQLKAKYNLHSDLEVEHYFLRRMADSVRKQGMTLIGWDEIVEAGLPNDSTIVMWWRHDKPTQLARALQLGYQVVLCPRLPLYSDFVQTGRDKVGRRWGKEFNTMQDVINFNVDSLSVNVSPYQKQIIGMQANLWTETVKTSDRLEYLIFPRLMAMAQAAWNSHTAKENFTKKISTYYPLWQKENIHYFDVSHPEKTPEITDKAQKIEYLDNK